MNTRAADYTKTGNGWLTSLGNKLSLIPGGGLIGGPLIYIDTLINTVGWLIRFKPLSAASTFASGFTSATINTASGVGGPIASLVNPIYWGNVASAGITGRTLGTHGRALTEGAASFVTRPLGMQPTVLRSHYAGVGGMGGAAPATPGRFASQISGERGQNAQDQYNNYMRGEGGVHVNQLQSAYGRGA